MEVVLPESAELSEIEPGLLAPGVLPDLWTDSDVSVGDVRAYFSGGKVIKVARQGYDEPVTIPKAPQAVVDGAIGWAVKEGKLWLTHGATSLYAEEIPAGLPGRRCPVAATARADPRDGRARPRASPMHGRGEVTTAHAITEALSAKAGKPLPWSTVRAAIDGAFQGRLLERTVESGPWPCDFAGAKQVKVKVRRDSNSHADTDTDAHAAPGSSSPRRT